MGKKQGWEWEFEADQFADAIDEASDRMAAELAAESDAAPKVMRLDNDDRR